MPKNHVIISGTGRTGTTSLVQILTKLGLDTGHATNAEIFAESRAGLEWPVSKIYEPDAPYILKSPLFCEELETIMSSGDITIDHAIVPIRDLFNAAESRREVRRRTVARFPAWFPGGLWGTNDPKKQEEILRQRLYNLMLALAKWEIPLTLLYYPKFLLDPAYLYEKISVPFHGIDRSKFQEVFDSTVQPELIHDYMKNGN
jgi:hypothetical protein